MEADDFKENPVKKLSYKGVKFPTSRSSQFLRKLGSYTLVEEHTKSFIPDPQNAAVNRILLLNQSFDERNAPQEIMEFIKAENAEIIEHTVKVESTPETLEKTLKSRFPLMDPIVKQETLKGIKIITLSENQVLHCEEIAKLIFEKFSQGVDVVVAKAELTHEALNKFFYLPHFKYIFGDMKKTIINIEEGGYQFQFDILKVFYDPSLQEERKRVINTFSKQEVIADLLGDHVLDVRLIGEGFKLIVNTNDDYMLYKSIDSDRSLNNIPDSAISLHNTDFFSFLKNIFTIPYKSTQEFATKLYLGYRFLKDLTFIGTFVGLFNKINPSKFYEEGKDESNYPTLIFNLLIDQKKIKDSFKDYIITNLNSFCQSHGLDNLFQTSDIESIAPLDHKVDGSRAINVSLKLNSKIMKAPIALGVDILGIAEKMETNENGCGKRKFEHDNDSEGKGEKKIEK